MAGEPAEAELAEEDLPEGRTVLTGEGELDTISVGIEKEKKNAYLIPDVTPNNIPQPIPSSPKLEK